MTAVEAVARAIVATQAWMLPWEEQDEDVHAKMFTVARAAVEALHEFSPAVAEAGRAAYNWRGAGYQEDADKMFGGSRVFHAMLDAILSEVR